MAKQSLPADLAGIIEPLREADEYTRLQHIRQRGFYNLITGLPMFFFLLLPTLIPGLAIIGQGTAMRTLPVYLFATAIQMTLFGISCYPQLFIPVVQRHRPDWRSPLIEASLLKRALEKHFWLQFLFFILFETTLMVPFVFGVDYPLDLVGASLLALACLTLAWQSSLQRDRPLTWVFLAMTVLAGVFFLPRWTFAVGELVFAWAIVLPPLVVGLARLLAPRRVLVR